MSTPDFEASIQALINRHEENIAEIGWSIQVTFADQAKLIPGYATTMGLTLHGLPEIIVFALPTQHYPAILGKIAQRMIAGTLVAEPGRRIEQVINMPMAFADVESEHGEFFGAVCMRWASNKGLQPRFMLAQYADEHGRLPSDPACDMRIAALQDAAEIYQASNQDS